MGLVRGEDVLLTVLQNEGDTPVQVPFGCARSITFDISTDFIETSVTQSGSFKTFIPSGKQYTGNIEGLVFINKPANGETRATTTINYSNVDTDLFPNFNSLATIYVNTLPTYTNICDLAPDTYTNISDYINAIIGNINGLGTGYSAALGAGNTFVITAPIGSGNTLNGINNSTSLNVDGTVYSYSTPFTGGISAYYPDKLGIGWMYDKLISGEEIFLKYYETDDDNHFLQKQCSVYIESINETSSFDNIVTFSASFKGNGDPIITYGEI
jgi:hypothetical protein